MFFCFRTQDGETFCLSAISMGQRHSSEVASSLMNVLADFDTPGGEDRYRMAVTEFSSRCDQVDKTVTIRRKVIDRIAEVLALRRTWTHRQYVGCMASLLWCAGPAEGRYRRTLCFDFVPSRDGENLFFNPNAWDAAIVVPESVRADLCQWVVLALANEPHPILAEAVQPTAYMCTDASAWGWGAIFARNGATAHAQMPWGTTLRGAHRSTTAEPEAIWRAACKFVKPDDCLTVCVLTDHSGLVHRYPKGFSASAAYNGVILRLHRRFPHVTFELRHVPGKENIADGLSRGPLPAAESGETKLGYRQVEGLAAKHAL
jgi:hypothetical protein